MTTSVSPAEKALSMWRSIAKVSTAAGERQVSLRSAILGVLTIFTMSADRRRELETRVEQLELRLCDLEKKKSFHYAGIWTDGQAYGENDFVTHQGSLWHCGQQTIARPGDGDHWQLCCKRGTNGRDLRS